MTDEPAANEPTSDVSDLAHRVGEDLSGLIQTEVDAAKEELAPAAKEGAAGAGLVGAAAVAGAMALLFGSLALWRGLGTRIGATRSAVLVGALYGGAAVVLSAKGGVRLAEVVQRLS